MDPSVLILISIVVTGVFFLALVLSGGVISVAVGGVVEVDEAVLRTVLRVHQVAPWLAAVSSALTIYLLAGGEVIGQIAAMR